MLKLRRFFEILAVRRKSTSVNQTKSMSISSSTLHRRGGDEHKDIKEPSEDNSKGNGKKLLISTKQYACFAILVTAFLLIVVTTETSSSSHLRSFMSTRGLSLNKNEVDSEDTTMQAKLEPGEMMPLAWHSNRNPSDESSRFIGLPPELIAELEAFCIDSGLKDSFQSVAYREKPANDTVDMGTILLKDKYKGMWGVSSPSQYNYEASSDLHWFDPINEEALEEVLDVLKKGDFEQSLQGPIRNAFESQGLSVYDVGFFVLTHSSGESDSRMARPATDNEFINLMIPLFHPKNDQQNHRSCIAPGILAPNIGVLTSGEDSHATGECDFNENNTTAVVAAVYLADTNEDDSDIQGELKSVTQSRREWMEENVQM